MNQLFAYFLLLTIVPMSFAVNNTSGLFSVGIMEPLAMVFFRWFGAALVMLPFMGGALWQCRHIIKQHFWFFVLASFLGMFICPAAAFVAGRYTTAINISLIYTLAPIFVIILERFVYGVRLSYLNMTGVALAIAGVITVISKGDIKTLLQLQASVGDVMVLFGAVSWAVYLLMLRKQESYMAAGKRLFTLNAILGSILAIPFMTYEIVVLDEPLVFTTEFFILVVVLTFVSSIAAYMGIIYIANSLSPTISSYASYFVPPYGAAIGIIFFGETLHAYHIIAAVTILFGVFLATKKKPQQDNVV